MASTENRSLQVSSSVKSTDTPDGVVLLDVRGGMTFPLDQVSTFIWKRLEQQLSVNAIAQEIASVYHIPFEQASVDVEEFIQQLIAHHLLVEAGAATESTKILWSAAWGHLWRWITRDRSASQNTRISL